MGNLLVEPQLRYKDVYKMIFGISTENWKEIARHCTKWHRVFQNNCGVNKEKKYDYGQRKENQVEGTHSSSHSMTLHLQQMQPTLQFLYTVGIFSLNYRLYICTFYCVTIFSRYRLTDAYYYKQVICSINFIRKHQRQNSHYLIYLYIKICFTCMKIM